MKSSVALFALVGLVGCFLPLAGDASFFDLRHLEWLPVILMVGAFALPLAVGARTASLGAALAGLVGFGYVALKFRTGMWDLAVHGSIGGRMMVVGAVGGLVASLGALADRKQA